LKALPFIPLHYIKQFACQLLKKDKTILKIVEKPYITNIIVPGTSNTNKSILQQYFEK